MDPKQKFNIGDKIIGTKGNYYPVTGEGSICEVISLCDEGRIDVRLVEPANPKMAVYIGNEYRVVASCLFEPLTPKITSDDIDALLFSEMRREGK